MEDPMPRTGDQTERLWAKFHAALKGFILSKVGDEMVADDILQEVFIRIHEKIGTLKDATRVQAWIYQVARNLVTDHFRKERRSAVGTLPEEGPDTEREENFMREAVEDMIRMMDDLPASYCEALCMTELDGMSLSDYAARAGISYTAARSRIHRGRRMLKDLLLKCCHYESDRYGTILDITPACCCCHPPGSGHSL